MKKNNVIILVLCLTILFAIAFGYMLFKCCVRATKAEIYDLEFQKDQEWMLIWLLLYYAHRYIHHQCLQLDHWFHLISPRETAARCCDQEKYMGCETCLRDRTRSARQERGRERSTKRYRSRDHEGHRAREADPEWIAQPKLQRPRRMLQMGAPAQNQWFGQPDYQQTPWQEQIPVPTQMSYPQAVAYSQMPQQGALPIFTPAYGPHMTNPTKAATMPEPVNYQHQHRHQQAQSEDRSDATRSKHTVIQTDKLPPQRKRNRGPAKVDYIHICDELPSIVLKSLKKSTIATSTTSSSSDSSGDSSTTQEVPRVSIPRAAPKATDTLPFQYPEYAYNPARPHIPATDPKPWIDDTAKGGRSKFKSRYAPFEPMSCQKEQSRRVRADGKQPAPSNVPICH
ncbi:hypothetical protein T440DRAFT_526237 [Plenodomus tracheiphilus IPT5]|uniref:Uncharacterized protein n=1 Tax=Plenodomus tracheiphilus IPT5 TaxID=1408161 RepID=A0A6A7BBK5_9PLEO|nr:hypothetical protein T440DRAFT_526237 [Plenodomus tracheiphilus IPT5]